MKGNKLVRKLTEAGQVTEIVRGTVDLCSSRYTLLPFVQCEACGVSPVLSYLGTSLSLRSELGLYCMKKKNSHVS